MKRKDSHFLDFFGSRGVTGEQTLTALPAGWIVDFRVLDVPEPVWEVVCGQQVPSLVVGARWVYWIPRSGHHTLLVFLNASNEPQWFYADVIETSGLDDSGYPWTDDLYLDVVALGAVTPDNSWLITDTEIIDMDELDAALSEGKVTQTQFDLAWAEARRVESMLRENAFPPLDVVQAHLNTPYT